MEAIIVEYMQILLDALKYDIGIYKLPWMFDWWWCMIPPLVYSIFMLFKWSILTIPVWMPFAMVVIAARATLPNFFLFNWLRSKVTPSINQSF